MRGARLSVISKYAISDKNSDMNTLDELELCTEFLFLHFNMKKDEKEK